MIQISGPAGFLHIDDGGTGGIPVVFVHSFAGSTAHWAAQLAHLRKTRRGVALDLRSHGQSASPTRDDYGVESLAEDIAAVADGLKLKSFVLVGHSMGGSASLAYVSAHPERVAGLVLVGTPGKIPAEQAQQVMASLKSDYENVMTGYWDKLLTNAQPGVLAQIQGDRKRLPRPVSLSLIQAIFDYDPMPALRRYRGPKLAVSHPIRTIHTTFIDSRQTCLTKSSAAPATGCTWISRRSSIASLMRFSKKPFPTSGDLLR